MVSKVSIFYHVLFVSHFSPFFLRSLFCWHLLITETELIQAESPELFYLMLVSRARRSVGEQDDWELSALISPALGWFNFNKGEQLLLSPWLEFSSPLGWKHVSFSGSI